MPGYKYPGMFLSRLNPIGKRSAMVKPPRQIYVPVSSESDRTACFTLRGPGLNRIRYFFSNTSLITFSKSSLPIAPCTICGLPSIGTNSSVGIERMPKAAASSCSFSVSIL